MVGKIVGVNSLSDPTRPGMDRWLELAGVDKDAVKYVEVPMSVEPAAVEWEFAEARYGDFKAAVAEGVVAYLAPVQERYGALRAGSYDVAHAVYAADALAAARWRRTTGGPAILSYMGIPDRQGIREFRKQREVLLTALRGCNVAVALSRHAGTTGVAR